MSQAIDVTCLTKTQIKTTLDNLAKVLHLTNCQVIFNGKPEFSKANEERWNLPHMTKFADNYTLYKYSIAEDTTITKKGEPFYILTLETDKFDKFHIHACCWFWHLMEDDLKTNYTRPHLYLCPAYTVTPGMLLHVPTSTFPCNYRFVTLVEMYPMLGSPNCLFGLTYDYDIVPYEDSYSGRKHPFIKDSDIMVKILNGMEKDLIRCKRVMFEVAPYTEYSFRSVIRDSDNARQEMSPSGICYNETTQ